MAGRVEIFFELRATQSVEKGGQINTLLIFTSVNAVCSRIFSRNVKRKDEERAEYKFCSFK